MERLHVEIITLFLITPIFLLSCDSEPTFYSEKMRDGQIISLRNGLTHFYANESQFLSDIPMSLRCNYSFLSTADSIYQTDKEYFIEGYDDRYIGLWEKASFGDWISEYGLTPNQEYYCSWLKYVIYVPILTNADYIPIFPMENMGHVSWTDKPCFDTEFQNDYPKEILYTYVRYIGYDNNKKGIYKEIPNLNKLVWKLKLKN